jgi:hypothetical protein
MIKIQDWKLIDNSGEVSSMHTHMVIMQNRILCVCVVTFSVDACIATELPK